MNITGNTALITGGGSGIGLALARAFHGQNNRVIIVGRDKHKLTAARRECPDLHAIQADITSEHDRQQLVNKIRKKFPEMNMLVNCAGIAFFSDLHSDPDACEKVRQEVETNYLAPVCLIELLIEQLLRQPSAAIVNVTTIGAYLPLAIMPGYSASKAALSSFTRSLRLQLSHMPLRVYEVLPPPVETKMVSAFHVNKMQPDQLAAAVLQGVKKDRYEMPIGSARILQWLARLAPCMSSRISHNQLLKSTRNR